jgi:hypothetical protein
MMHQRDGQLMAEEGKKGAIPLFDKSVLFERYVLTQSPGFLAPHCRENIRWSRTG